jgi:hypothetical protein
MATPPALTRRLGREILQKGLFISLQTRQLVLELLQATTADIYAHVTPATLHRTAARMDAILGQRKSSATA